MSLLHATLELHEHKDRSRRLKVFDCGNASKCGRKKKIVFFFICIFMLVFFLYISGYFIYTFVA